MNDPLRRLCLVVLAIVVAGCGGGNATGPTSGPTSSSATAAPTAASSATATPATAPVSIAAVLDHARTSYGAPGATAIVRVGDSEWSSTSGTADRSGAVITDDTRFRIASITKPVVATMVLQSVRKGELGLDDVVGNRLPGVIRPTPPVTIRQLLNHTSGIFDESNDGNPIADIVNLADPDLKAEAQDLLKRYQAGEHVIGSDRLIVALSETHDRYFAPGQGYHYSNTNYQIAAMLLEKVTGKTLAELLKTRIVEPLGLKRTTIAPPDTATPELHGYGISTTDGSLVDITDDLISFGNGGNGGIISTRAELLTLMQSIVNGKLLPDDLATEMKTPAQQSYGLGIATYTFTCGTFYGHEGGVNGTASIAIVSATGDRGVVVALNLRSTGDPHLPALADTLLCAASSGNLGR